MAEHDRYAIIPGQDELARMDRDLQFHPCTNPAPKTLTPGQIRQFNSDGYLKGIRVFDDAEAAGHRDYFDRLLEGVLAAGGDSYSISTAHLRYGGVWDLLTHPRIAAVVTDLLGPDVIGWGSHYFCKLPGDGKVVAWHQDASYWPLTPSKTVTVWLAVDDADRGNACMQFLPGSHRYGHLTYRMSERTEANVLDQTVEGIEHYGDPVFVELKAGELSVHSDLLLHGSEANPAGGRRRCGLTLRYCTPDVRAGLGWSAKGVLVAGTSAGTDWSNRPRPPCD